MGTQGMGLCSGRGVCFFSQLHVVCGCEKRTKKSSLKEERFSWLTVSEVSVYGHLLCVSGQYIMVEGNGKGNLLI
jgi:hypothetical protein